MANEQTKYRLFGMRLGYLFSMLVICFMCVFLLIVLSWALAGARISYSGFDDQGSVWMACGSLYGRSDLPLIFLALFGTPSIILILSLAFFRYCSKRLGNYS
jgi:hypothetical protein